MPRLWHIAAWPMVVKVPVLVAGLMVTAAVTTSELVLWRFAQEQEKNLALLTNTYLDGLSASIMPGLVRQNARELFDAFDRARQNQYAGVEPRFAILELPNGVILASSDPRQYPVEGAVPRELHNRFNGKDGLVLDLAARRAWAARTLRIERASVGRLFTELDITNSLRVRREVLLSLVLVNGCLTIAFALGGYFALRRMLRPFGILTRYVEQIRDGRVEPIPANYRGKVASEFRQIFDRFDSMARAFVERQKLAAQFAEQERCAMLGRLASGMAHEVNNPLGGMLNAIDTIQAHGRDPAVLETSLEFLKRGLAGIRNVVHAILTTYKNTADTGPLAMIDLEDLRFLVQHEVVAKRLTLAWENGIVEPIAIDGPAVRQITLNLLLNACAASPTAGRVEVAVRSLGRELEIVVRDHGTGLPREMVLLLDQIAAGAAPLPEGKGLGLWTTANAVRRLGGHIEVQYPGIGTRVVVTLPIAVPEVFHVAA